MQGAQEVLSLSLSVQKAKVVQTFIWIKCSISLTIDSRYEERPLLMWVIDAGTHGEQLYG